jgi:hypothetical protein
MKEALTNKFLFIGCVVIIGIFLIVKMMPPIALFCPVKMVLTKQIGNIVTLDDTRKADFTRNFVVPTILFPEGEELYHPVLGYFGYKYNFFMDFTVNMDVKKEGYYHFIVGSDDGFRLHIDSNILGEFTNNRSFSLNDMMVYLNKGKHQVLLNYFQGFGRQGLTAYYQYDEQPKKYLVGKSSSYIRFF